MACWLRCERRWLAEPWNREEAANIALAGLSMLRTHSSILVSR
ncbi:hypothetical protein [Lysobacter gummosus]